MYVFGKGSARKLANNRESKFRKTRNGIGKGKGDRDIVKMGKV